MATNITAITDTVNVNGEKGPRQFQGLFDIIPFKFSGDDDSLPAQTASQCDVSVPGAALGDFVLVACVADLVNISLTAFVSAADVVTVQAENVEGTDASTALAGNPAFKGVVLKPKSNIFDNF
jgi:hypothetical protein